jgi:hypothetical protein
MNFHRIIPIILTFLWMIGTFTIQHASVITVDISVSVTKRLVVFISDGRD